MACICTRMCKQGRFAYALHMRRRCIRIYYLIVFAGVTLPSGMGILPFRILAIVRAHQGMSQSAIERYKRCGAAAKTCSHSQPRQIGGIAKHDIRRRIFSHKE